jgi:hypothetical protein
MRVRAPPAAHTNKEVLVIRAQRSQGPDAADWSLTADELGPADVVLELRDAVIDSDLYRRGHCPACGDVKQMQLAVTRDGEHYDRCVGCGLLWHVDREAGRVLGIRLTRSPPRRR